jgi:threonine/homoserine/homoserine lactone efflux protein
MTPETALALTGFAFAMSISPGPGNFLLLASGANFGFRRTVPTVLGISLGFLTMVFLVGIGLGEVLDRVPVLTFGLKLAGAAYVLWLALKIARSRALGPGDPGRIEKPVSFVQAALLQLLNPKAWAVALILTVTYASPGSSTGGYLAGLMAMIALFAVVNIPSISVWAISGTALRGVLAKGNRIAAFNLAMAVLLLASMAPVLLPG